MDLEPKYEDLKKEISRRNPGDAIDTDEFKVYPIEGKHATSFVHETILCRNFVKNEKNQNWEGL